MEYSWRVKIKTDFIKKRIIYLEEKLIQTYRIRGKNIAFLAYEKELGEYYKLFMLARGHASKYRKEAA